MRDKSTSSIRRSRGAQLNGTATKLAIVASVLLVLSSSIASAQEPDSVADCSPLPKVLRWDLQPFYPPNVKPDGLPNPVLILLEFTVTPRGRATRVQVVETNAGAYAREFGEQAVKVVAAAHFKRIPTSCRGRMTITFKTAE